MECEHLLQIPRKVIKISKYPEFYLQHLPKVVRKANRAIRKHNPDALGHRYSSLKHTEPVWRTFIANRSIDIEKPTLEYEHMFEVLRGASEVPPDFEPSLLDNIKKRFDKYT